MAESKTENINDLLVKKALRTEPDILATACPLCLTTLTEAANRSKGELECLDISEIVYKAL